MQPDFWVFVQVSAQGLQLGNNVFCRATEDLPHRLAANGGAHEFQGSLRLCRTLRQTLALRLWLTRGGGAPNASRACGTTVIQRVKFWLLRVWAGHEKKHFLR